jgi:hypothetical protein
MVRRENPQPKKLVEAVKEINTEIAALYAQNKERDKILLAGS